MKNETKCERSKQFEQFQNYLTERGFQPEEIDVLYKNIQKLPRIDRQLIIDYMIQSEPYDDKKLKENIEKILKSLNHHYLSKKYFGKFRLVSEVEKIQVIEKDVHEDTSDKAVESLFFLAAFLYNADEREAAIGDLTEKFEKWRTRFGYKRAKKLLVWDILKSLKPTFKEGFRVRSLQMLKALGLYKLIRYFWDLYWHLSN